MTQVAANSLVSGSLLALVAASFWVAYGVVRFFHFSHAAILTLGAYTAYGLMESLGAVPAVAVALAVLVGASSATLLDTILYQPIGRRGGDALVLLLASLGVYTVVINVLVMTFGAGALFIHSASSLRGRAVVLGAGATSLQMYLVLSAFLVVAAMYLALTRTQLGLWYRATADNPDYASTLAIPQRLVRLAAVATGGGVVAAAGAWLAMDVQIQSGMGFRPLVLAVVAVIVGQRWGLLGVVGSAAALSAMVNLSAYFIGARWQDITAALFLAMILLPFHAGRSTRSASW